MLNYLDRMDLPQWYDENIMTALAINPKTVYFYWELSFGQWKALHGCQLLLNLYQLPLEGEENHQPRLVKKIVLPPFTENWYFHDLQPARRYQAEMGREQDERFFSIIKSNTVELPPAAPFALPVKAEMHPAAETAPAATNTINQPTGETMQHLVDTMSFYMGINKAS